MSFRKHPDQVYRCEPFLEFAWLDHGFGTRASDAWVTAHPPVTLRQIHSGIVVDADGLSDRACEGDALFTDVAGKRIGVRTADCVPLLIIDPCTKVVSAIHAGWRGTHAGIVKKAVEAMASAFGSDAQELHVAIGPAIRVCCYEVGADVADRFAGLFPEWSRLGTARKIDLIEANRRWLHRSGVSDGKIYDAGLCTFCQAEEFYSYRREPQNPGRMLSCVERIAQTH